MRIQNPDEAKKVRIQQPNDSLPRSASEPPQMLAWLEEPLDSSTSAVRRIVNSWPAGITCNPDGGIAKIMLIQVVRHKLRKKNTF